MALEKVITIKGNTTDAVASFETLTDTIQEQKDITIEFEKELRRLEEQLKATGKASFNPKAIKIKEQISNLKDAIKDQRLSLKSLNNERKKANKIGDSTLQNVTKNYGAIQILDQFTGGLATQIRSAVDASRLFNISLKGTRKALIATGIGAFVVALGLVIANWEKITNLIKGVNLELEKQKRINDDIINQLEQQAFLRKLNEEFVSKEVEGNILRAKIAGATEKELFEIRKKGAEDSVKLAEEAAEEANRVLQNSVDADAEVFEKASKAQEEAFKARGEARATLANLQLEEDLRLANARRVAFEKQVEENRKETELLSSLRVIKRNASKDITDQLQKDLDERAEKRRIANEAELSDDLRTQVQIIKNKKETAEFEESLDKAVANAKLNIASDASALIGQLVERDSALGKGVAVAQATISGFQGTQNAFTTASASPITIGFPAYPFIQAGLAGAFSALQIKNILSTNPKTGGGASAPSTGGGGGAAAPSFNLVAGTGANQIAEGLAGQNQPIKAFVVASDVSSGQSLDRNIISNSSL